MSDSNASLLEVFETDLQNAFVDWGEDQTDVQTNASPTLSNTVGVSESASKTPSRKRTSTQAAITSSDNNTVHENDNSSGEDAIHDEEIAYVLDQVRRVSKELIDLRSKVPYILKNVDDITTRLKALVLPKPKPKEQQKPMNEIMHRRLTEQYVSELRNKVKCMRDALVQAGCDPETLNAIPEPQMEAHTPDLDVYDARSEHRRLVYDHRKRLVLHFKEEQERLFYVSVNLNKNKN